MALGEKIVLTFVDYSAAFNTVSHKFLDDALADAGAPAKVRAMFRAVYSAASAFTTVSVPDRKVVKSKVFKIRREVVQGDITSPLFFILALELILRRYDNREDKGVSFMGSMLHTLGYADDIGLADEGSDEGVQRTTERVSSISQGSERSDADMKINLIKTKALHVRSQNKVSKTTCAEASKLCKHVCPHVGCGYRFLTKRGMQIHAGRCTWKNEFEMEGILDCKGGICERKYLIKWKGFSADHNTWEPRGNVHPDAITEFEKENDRYVYDWTRRCPICDLPFKSERGVKIHVGRYYKENETPKQQDHSHMLVDKAVQVQKLVLQQANRPVVQCCGVDLENVFKFSYLGTIVAADGNQMYDIK